MGNGGQGAHCGALEGKARQRCLAWGALTANAGFLQYPAPRLSIQIHHVAKLPERQKVALQVFDARLDDALLLRIVWRTGIDPEAIPLRTVCVGALHLRVVHAGLGDGALGVVNDDLLGHGRKPLEGTAVTAEPGGDGLVSDEFNVMVPGEAQGHDEGVAAILKPVET